MSQRLPFLRRYYGIVLLLWLLSPMVTAAPQFRNAALSTSFSENDGAWSSFTAIAGNHSFLAQPCGIWRIQWLEPQGWADITPEKARHFRWEGGEADPLRLYWTDFGLAECPRLEVMVTVAPADESALSKWHITVKGLEKARIRELAFPCLEALTPSPKEILAVPYWMGERTDQARALLNKDPEHPGNLAWEYPGVLSMQCMACYSEEGSGIYIACDDRACHRKVFGVHGGRDNALGMTISAHPVDSDVTAGCYSLPYTVQIGLLEGGWFGAARQYKRWADQQAWRRESRIQKKETPDWALQTGLWIWNRGRSEEVLAPALCLQEAAGIPVSVFWHWWHGCSYDTGFPEYLPPREGDASFHAALTEAHQKGLHAIVYMNQRLWGMTTRSWREEGAEAYAVKNAQGKVDPEVYNTYTKAPCASMCMGTAFWRNKYAEIASDALRLGADGVYMDQACSSMACYDPAHGHPIGGGVWWMQGFQQLAADIRRRNADPLPLLAGEGCGESWLPHLDLMLSLQVSLERYAEPGIWEPIPFFHAVYHDCALLYGNYSSLACPPYDELWPKASAPENPTALLDRKYITQFRLEQARSFLWGQQPTIANFRPEQLTERSDEIAFLLKLAKIRYALREFLLYGEMMPPPALTTPSITIPMSRLSIYAGQQGAVREFTRSAPSVAAAVWKSPGGELALFLVNITDAPVSPALSMTSAEYPMAEKGKIERLTEKGRTPFLAYDGGNAVLNPTLAPGEAAVFFAPEK